MTMDTRVGRSGAADSRPAKMRAACLRQPDFLELRPGYNSPLQLRELRTSSSAPDSRGVGVRGHGSAPGRGGWPEGVTRGERPQPRSGGHPPSRAWFSGETLTARAEEAVARRDVSARACQRHGFPCRREIDVAAATFAGRRATELVRGAARGGRVRHRCIGLDGDGGCRTCQGSIRPGLYWMCSESDQAMLFVMLSWTARPPVLCGWGGSASPAGRVARRRVVLISRAALTLPES